MLLASIWGLRDWSHALTSKTKQNYFPFNDGDRLTIIDNFKNSWNVLNFKNLWNEIACYITTFHLGFWGRLRWPAEEAVAKLNVNKTKRKWRHFNNSETTGSSGHEASGFKVILLIIFLFCFFSWTCSVYLQEQKWAGQGLCKVKAASVAASLFRT